MRNAILLASLAAISLLGAAAVCLWHAFAWPQSIWSPFLQSLGLMTLCAGVLATAAVYYECESSLARAAQARE